MHAFGFANCEDLMIVLPSSINLFKFVFILCSPELLFLGFCVFFNAYQFDC